MRIFNALGFIILCALIIMQRDVDGEALIAGYHGLGLTLLLAFIFAILNVRGELR